MHSTHENTLTHVLAYASELQHSALQVVQDGFTGGIISLFCEGEDGVNGDTTNSFDKGGGRTNANACDIMPTSMSLYTLSNLIIQAYFVPSNMALVESQTSVYNCMFDGTWRDLFTLIILIFPDCFARVRKEASNNRKNEKCWFICADEIEKDQLRQECHSEINNNKEDDVKRSQETNSVFSTMANRCQPLELLDLNVKIAKDSLTHNIKKEEGSVVSKNKITSLPLEPTNREESFELTSDDCTFLEWGSLQTMAEHRFQVGLLLLASINNTLHDVQVRTIREKYKSNTLSNKTNKSKKVFTLNMTCAHICKENKNENENVINNNCLHELTTMSSLRTVERLMQRAKLLLLSCLCVTATNTFAHTPIHNEYNEEWYEDTMHEASNLKKENVALKQQNRKHVKDGIIDDNHKYVTFVLLTGGQFAKSVEEWGWLQSDNEHNEWYDNLLNRINTLFSNKWEVSSKYASEITCFEAFLKVEYNKLFIATKEVSPFTSPLAYSSKNACRGVFFDCVSQAMCTPALPRMPIHSGELTYLLPSSIKSNANDFVMCETLSELQTLLSKCALCKIVSTDERTMFAYLLPTNLNTELGKFEECTLLSFFSNAVHVNGFLKHNPHVLAQIVRWCYDQRKLLHKSDEQKVSDNSNMGDKKQMQISTVEYSGQVPLSSIYVQLEYIILNQVLIENSFDVNVGYFLQELATINALTKHTFICWITDMIDKQKLATSEHSVGNIIVSLINFILISCRWEKDAELLKLYANLRLEIRRHNSM